MKPIQPFDLSPTHTVCRCARCTADRLLRMLNDLDKMYDRQPAADPERKVQ